MNKILGVGLKMAVAAIGIVVVDNTKEIVKEKIAKNKTEKEIKKEVN